MKNRSRRTARREAKRLERKRVRAAERDVLRGGRPRRVRFGEWNRKSHQTAPIDEGEHRPAPSKRKRQHKDYWCPGRPGRKRHEYLSEIVYGPSPLYWYRLHDWWRHEICAWCGKERWRRASPPGDER